MQFGFARGRGMGLLLALVGAGRNGAFVDVGRGSLRVRFGLAFRLEVPLAAVVEAEERAAPIPLALGVGVHGWRGVWAVNGARRPHVVVRFSRPQRARTFGIPVRVHTLHLAPDDPGGLTEALRGTPTPGQPAAP